MQSRRTEQSGFRPDIEGLRAVAVLAVVLFHADVPGVGGGFVGVDVFFVISGFLITGLLWREVSTTGSVGLRRFYGARARRLLPASATVGVVTAIGAAVLLPPLQARPVIGDGIASALYVSNYWFALARRRLLRRPPAAFAVPALLVVGRRGAVLPGVAAPDHRHGVADPACASAHQAQAPSSERPYLVVLALVAAVSFALSLVITYVVTAVAFFSLPTRAWQLAAGGLVALTADRWRRLPPRAAAITGWAGLARDPAGLHPVERGHPLSGYRRAVARAGRGAGDRRRLCRTCAGMRPCPGVVADACDRPDLVLVVSVALAGAGARTGIAGPPVGAGRRLAAALLSGGLAVLTLRFIENPLRFAAPIRRSAWASLALGGVATAVAVCVGVALLVWVPVPVGRGAPATPLTITAAPAPAGSDIDAYDAAVQHAFAQVQAAVAASADLKAVPSNLNPPIATRQPNNPAMFFNGCLRKLSEDGQPECARATPPRRRRWPWSATRMPRCGIRRSSRSPSSGTGGWRPWPRRAARCWTCPSPTPYFAGNTPKCEQWRGQILARLRAEHPRLVVLSMCGDTVPLRLGVRFHVLRPGVDRQPDPPRAAAARHWRQGAGARADPGSALIGADLPVRPPRDATACSPPRSTAVNEAGIAAETAATKAGGGQYTDLTELFCTAERCPVIVGNTLVYIDKNHVTFEYSRLLAPAIGALADRALAHG